MRRIRWLVAFAVLAVGGWWVQSALMSPPALEVEDVVPAPPARPEAAPTSEIPPEPAPVEAVPDEVEAAKAAPAVPPEKQVELKIGKTAFETDKAVPPFLVLEKIMEQELQKPDRVEYDLLEITIFVRDEPTRYLAAGPRLNRQVDKLPEEVRSQLAPWEQARYAGDFPPYRVYELR